MGRFGGRDVLAVRQLMPATTAGMASAVLTAATGAICEPFAAAVGVEYRGAVAASAAASTSETIAARLRPRAAAVRIQPRRANATSTRVVAKPNAPQDS